MKKNVFFTNHRVFILALVLALVGAVLLGSVLSSLLRADRVTEMLVKRERKNGIYEDSDDWANQDNEIGAANDLLTESFLPQKAETAEEVYAIVKHAAAALGCPSLPEEYETAYVEERENILGEIEPAYWVVSEALSGYGAEAETQPYRTSVYYKAAVDPQTGRLIDISYLDYIMRFDFAEQGAATAADGEAVLQEHEEYLSAAAAHIRALYPSEHNVRAKLKSVGLERGHLSVHVYVNTDADGIHMLNLMRKDGALVTVYYACGPEQWWEEADPTFTNYDVNGWWLSSAEPKTKAPKPLLQLADKFVRE